MLELALQGTRREFRKNVSESGRVKGELKNKMEILATTI